MQIIRGGAEMMITQNKRLVFGTDKDKLDLENNISDLFTERVPEKFKK